MKNGLETEVENIYVGTNNVSVEINVTESGSGIDKYHYYISSDGIDYTEYIAYTKNYTYTGLTAGTTYHLKIEVTDKAGHVSNTLTYDVITKVLEIQKGDIILYSVYGESGSGTAYFKVSDELEKEGYTTKYVVLEETASLTDSAKWEEGQQVDNVSTGTTIYVELTDGINTYSDYILSYNVTELETYSEIYPETTLYEDENKDQAYIPAGFKVGTSSLNKTIKSGLVIEDENGNQYVWVPVENAIYDSSDGTYPTSATNGDDYKPMAKYQNGYSSSTEQYFEGIVYNNWSSSYLYGSYAQWVATTYALRKW